LFVSEWEQESHQWKWAWARCQVSFPAVFERPTVCDCFRETNVVRRTDTGPSQGSASAVQIALHLDVYQLAGSHGKARCWGVKVSLTIALKLVLQVGFVAFLEDERCNLHWFKKPKMSDYVFDPHLGMV